MANNISLTAGMRQNLTALQNIDKLTQTTQNRLATGKKINSALDDPVNFFKANDHYNRANDLEAKKDGMSEAMKTIEAANTGIEKMEALLNQMKSLASAARTSTNATDLEGQFDTIMSQLSDLAGDASYGGQNLVSNATAGEVTTLTVDFNEDNSSKLDVTGFNVSYDKANNVLTLTTVAGTQPLSSDMEVASTAVAGAASTVAAAASTIAAATTSTDITLVGSALTAVSGAISNMATAGVDTTALTKAYESASSVVAAGNVPTAMNAVTNLITKVEIASGTAIGKLKVDMADFSSETGISKAINQIDGVISQLRTEAQKLSSSLSTISIRSDFTQAMVNTLNTGADNLTLADMNEEGANMLMLQTRQNLSTTALSLASQAAQAVLQLF
ncbi:hypothetical protein LJC22_03135 [Desulfosarcina sp. OttesenSCG-928-G10]|nr:hypothetical protein [Desulfosarcina sp. OttesenSCG-928-G10]MDL2321249.1 hypothetical protein [Desulfosarcina sp. OttesenSCG-928-B08]